MVLSNTIKSLGVHGFGTKQLEDLVSMDLEPSIFSLQMSLNRRSFDIDEAPCKVDGGREYNNAVMSNCYVICSDKEVLDSAKIPGVSLECFWERRNKVLFASQEWYMPIMLISLVSNIYPNDVVEPTGVDTRVPIVC